MLTLDAARRASGLLPAGDQGAQTTTTSTPPGDTTSSSTTTVPPESTTTTTTPVRHARHRCRPAPGGLGRPAREAPGRPPLQPLQAGARRHRGERGPRDLPHRARRRVPRWRRSGSPSAATSTGSCSPTSSGTWAINEDELADYQNDKKPYEQDDEIGKSGIERTMEAEPGTPGEVRYEVDARNVPVRRLEGGSKPIPGNDVYLSIDINLQYLTEKSLAAQLKVVNERRVCDVMGCLDGGSPAAWSSRTRDGSILSMASYPTYDPSEFIGGISTEAYASLTSQGNHEPLFNKAISGSYAPGSTWKLFSADAGLENGQITPSTPVNDPGFYDVANCETAAGARCRFYGFGRNELGRSTSRPRSPGRATSTSTSSATRCGVAPRAGRRCARPHLPQVGLRCRPRPGAARRGRWPGPRPEVAPVVRRAAVRGQRADRGLRHLAVRDEPQHRDRPGRRAGDAAPVGERLRHLRQRRHPVPPPARVAGGEVRERVRALGLREGFPGAGPARPRMAGRDARGTEGRDPLGRRRHRGGDLRRLPAGADGWPARPARPR